MITNGKSKTKRKILFIGMINSVHVAHWLSQIEDQNWDVYLFPVDDWAEPHFEIRNLSVYATKFFRAAFVDKSVRYIRWSSLSFYLDALSRRLMKQHTNKYKEQALAHVIKSIKPDIIHSLEFQHAGYLTLGAKKKFGNKFPTWIATCWGSDIYMFGRLIEHQEPIRQMMANCDYYSCECERDVQLAREMGFSGPVLPVLPARGGFNTEHMISFRQPGPVSNRKTIIVKGYQGWAGRALVAFQAFKRCLDILQGYTIVLYAVVEDIKIAARLFELETGIPIRILPPLSTDEEILTAFGHARVYIGLSISDGISTSLLEAMVMGAFPIQSCTACADEWIIDSKSGFTVPPEDPKAIADTIRKALTDDTLVNHAAELNMQTARERLDSSIIKPQVIEMYQNIFMARGK
ncbi:MAG: glycosyltransferase family 4 protein [Chloroflexi bacterium]|nr:glycosyltransferase family 4 protein [Chloroflexota bacterium]